jgi:glycosyltransferase involved in cell wall biosynthesis
MRSPKDISEAKVAIVHDWLTGMRGGEKCLEVFCELFPGAALFTLVHNKGSVSPAIEKMDIRTSFLGKIPGIKKNYRKFLPLFTFAVESFDLSGYDIVLSSSHCVAKGARIPKGALHICYCYTPVRYAWLFYDDYFSSYGWLKRKIISLVLSRLKKWDLEANKRVDYFIAISHNVKKRIKEFYSRDSEVIYPPVSGPDQSVTEAREEPGKSGYYLVVSALVPYKRVDLAVDVFNKTGKALVIIGTGPDMEVLKKKSAGNISFGGWVDDTALFKYYSGAKALIFPGEEDFGIVPLEAQLFGKPVIALGKGGVTETVVPLSPETREATGVFFHEQTVDALRGAVDLFEKNENLFDPGKLRAHAMKFNRDRFKKEIFDNIKEKWDINARQDGRKYQ